MMRFCSRTRLAFMLVSVATSACGSGPAAPPASSTPTSPSTDDAARAALRRELRTREETDVDLTARGRGANHPDVLCVRAEIRTLQSDDASWKGGGEAAVHLALLRASEACMLASGKGENHPEVKAVREKIRLQSGGQTAPPYGR